MMFNATTHRFTTYMLALTMLLQSCSKPTITPSETAQESNNQALIATQQTKEKRKECLNKLRDCVRAGKPVHCQNFDLRGAKLEGFDLRDGDFSGADFSGANLKGANLSKANLKGANLSGANLKGANLSKANLQSAKFVNAELQKANLCYAYLTKADLSYANMNGAKFKGADLHKVKYWEVGSAKGTLLDDKGFIASLNIEEYDAERKPEFQTSSNKNSLDLHGKIALDTKYQWIDKFIRAAYNRHLKTVEIITGRGLNNPSGKMGILWNLCGHYLLNGKFKHSIRGIHSISNDGGWEVFLQENKAHRIREVDKDIKDQEKLLMLTN